MVNIVLRKGEERGNVDLGWLQAKHTFSFSSYHDPNFVDFGCLRVLNEDHVEPLSGFGTHPHKDFEIFTYMIDGEGEHQDSMYHKETLRRGMVQFTTAGTGIRHSEKNTHPTKPSHLLQIWAKPKQLGLPPSYETLNFDEEKRINNFLPLISPGNRENSEIENTIGIHAGLYMSTSILQPGKSVQYSLLGKLVSDHKIYVHLVESSNPTRLVINQAQELKGGDGAFITDFTNSANLLSFTNQGNNDVEFVVLEILS